MRMHVFCVCVLLHVCVHIPLCGRSMVQLNQAWFSEWGESEKETGRDIASI